MKNESTAVNFIVKGAVIAALYVVLTLIFAPISFGVMQIRVAEMLTILPMFTPAAIPGLFIGCNLANLLAGASIWDIVFGSIATLIGAAGGYVLRSNRWLVPIPTIVSNTVFIPLVLRYAYGSNLPLLLIAGSVAVGEVIGCYVLGELLASVLLRRRRIFSDDAEQS